jgi:hypothetical protein
VKYTEPVVRPTGYGEAAEAEAQASTSAAAAEMERGRGMMVAGLTTLSESLEDDAVLNTEREERVYRRREGELEARLEE